MAFNFFKAFAILAFILNAVFAHAAPFRTTYQARIFKPDGQPLEAAGVNFRFSILDPIGSCVIYVEEYAAVNMTSSQGLVSFSLGAGVRSFPASGSSTTFMEIFNNATPSIPCQGGLGTYQPTAFDGRKIVMQFQDSSGWQTLPAMTINGVPYAMYANYADNATYLNGKADTAFVQKSTLPSCGAGEALHFNGVSFTCATLSSGGVTSASVIAAMGYTPADSVSLDLLAAAVSSSVSPWVTSGTNVIYSAGNVGIGNSISTHMFSVNKDQNAATQSSINNTSSGTAAKAMLSLGSDTGSIVIQSNSSTHSDNPGYGGAAGTSIWTSSGASNGLAITLKNASASLRFYQGGINSVHEKMRIHSNGFVGIAASSPTALLNIGAGTSSAASLKLSSGTLLSTPQAGAIEFDGFNFYTTNGSGLRNMIGSLGGSLSDASEISNSGNITMTPVGSVIVSSTTASTNSQTGALVVKGGLGVTGDIFSSGTIVTNVISGTDSLAINPNGGNVTIGIASSTAQFHVHKTLATGTITTVGTTVTGSGTNFLSAFSPGDYLAVDGGPAAAQIASIQSDSLLTLTAPLWFGNLTNPYPVKRVGSIFNNGNMGIGTTTPLSPLHVAINNSYSYAVAQFQNAGSSATVLIKGSNAVDAGGILEFHRSSSPISRMQSANGANGHYINFQMYSGGQMNERVRITSAGAVGIGTSAPTALLDIYARATSTASGDKPQFLNYSYVNPATNAAGTFLGSKSVVDSTGGNGSTLGFMYGGHSLVIHNDNTTLSRAYGHRGEAIVSAGTTSQVWGVVGIAITKTAASATDAVGVMGRAVHSSSNSPGALTGSESFAQVTTAGSKASLVYGHKIEVKADGGGGGMGTAFGNYIYGSATGTNVDNSYGVFVAAMPALNRYGIWQDDISARNVFKGSLGLGVVSPTAHLHLASGSATYAPLKFTSGTLLSSPQSGTMEYDGANFYLTDGTNTRRAISLGSSAGSIDNASNINSTGNITMTPTGSVIVSSTTASTDAQTGALVVNGGLGVSGVVNISSSLNVSGSSVFSGQFSVARAASYSPFNVYAETNPMAMSVYTDRAYSASTDLNHIRIMRSRSGAALNSGDNIGGIAIAGYTGSAFTSGWNGGAVISGFATENWSSTNRGTNLTFSTTTNSSTVAVERMRIEQNGNVGIGTTNPLHALHIASGTLKVGQSTSFEDRIAVSLDAMTNNAGSLNYNRFTGTASQSDNFSLRQVNNGSGVWNLNLFGERKNDNTQTTATQIATFTIAGKMGLGITNPTAYFHLKAGSSTVNTAPLKFASGTLNTAAEAGSMEYDGFNFYLTDGANTRRAISLGSSAGSIDNASNINSTGNITMTPAGSVVVSATTASTNSQTGSIVVKGGIGVAGDIYSSGTIVTSSNIQGVSVTATSGISAPIIQGNLNLSLNPNGGNVGIGTSNPTQNVHIHTSTSSGVRVRFSDLDTGQSSSDGVAMGLDNNENFSFYNNESTGDFLFGNSMGWLFAIKHSGNVGIGTAAPTARLHLSAGTSSTASLKLTSGTLLTSPQSGTMEYDGNNFYLTDGSNTRRVIATGSSIGSIDNASNINSTGNITMTPTGSVVVSATTASTNSQTGSIVVKGGMGVAGDIYSSGAIVTSSNIQGVSVTATSGISAPIIQGNLNLSLNPSGGNVGIGSINPSSTLDIVGSSSTFVNSRITNTGTGTSAYWLSTAAGGPSGLEQDSLGTLYLKQVTSASLQFWTNNGEKMRVTSAGALGIGTASPYSKLSVVESGSVPNNTSSDRAFYMTVHGPNKVITNGVNSGMLGVFANDSSVIADAGGSIALGATHITGAAQAVNAVIKSGRDNATSTDYGGYLSFFSRTNGQVPMERMRISSAGFVGIGTTSPSSKFHINSSGGFGDIAKFSNASSNMTLAVDFPSAGDRVQFSSYETSTGFGNKSISFAVSNTEIMRVNSNGNVGIGTTSPAVALEVSGATKIGGRVNILSDNVGGGNSQIYAQNSSLILSSGSPSGTNGNSNPLLFYTNSGSASSTEKMRIDSAGNVGIGTSNPDRLLTILGSGSNTGISIKRIISTNSAPLFNFYKSRGTSSAPTIIGTSEYLGALNFYGFDGASDTLGAQMIVRSDGVVSAGVMPARISFFTRSTSDTDTVERMRIDSNGNVGIGMTAPTKALEVSGAVIIGDINRTSNYNGGRIFQVYTGNMANADAGIDITRSAAGTYAATNQFSMRLKSDAGGVYRGYIGFASSDTPSEALTFLSNGNVGIATSSPTTALEVSGTMTARAVANYVVDAGAATTINWASGAVQYTTADCGAFSFSNMENGATYSLTVQGTNAGVCSFTHAGLTFKYPPNHGVTTAGTMTVYSFQRVGSLVMVSWIPGY